MVSTPKINLNNGVQMPVIGLGTYSAEPEEMIKVLKAAIDCGYRHFDCALVYRTEKYVGQAVREKIAEGVVKREDLFIVSKLWNTYHRPDLVIQGCKKTLENFGLDYIDLFLIHWPTPFQPVDQIKIDKEAKEVKGSTFILDFPEFFPFDENKQIIPGDVDYVDTWKAMERCVDMGLTRSIGVSNFNSQQIERLLKNARIKPVTNQVECNPNFNQKKLIDFCLKRDIYITAYGPLGLQIPTNPSSLMTNPKILSVAKELNKTPAQVILRYLVQLKTIPIPKTSKVERLSENISIFDFSLNDEQMAIMDSVNTNARVCIIPGTENHKNYPFSIEF